MDIWLPCVKFNIDTVEIRYSRPTELDLLFLRFINDRARRLGTCRLSDVLEVFAVMDSTVLHGMIHKLHMRYLQLFPDGTVDLRDGLETIIEGGDDDALTVQVGERNGWYPAYFDLFAGQIILDNRFTAVAEARIEGAQLLPMYFGQLDYEKPDVFPKQHYFALVNDYLRQRVSDDNQTESYRVQILRKLPEPDLGIQYLPLKVFKSGEQFQINAQDALPTLVLMRIAAKVNRMRSEASGSVAISSLQIESLPDDARAMGEQVERWLQRLSGAVAADGSTASFELRSWKTVAEMVIHALSSKGEVVLDNGYLIDAIERSPTEVYAALTGFLGRGGRLTIACEGTTVPESMPLWRTVSDFREFDNARVAPSLFVDAGEGAELRDLGTCRQFESQLVPEQLKRFSKKLRQAKEVQEIRYLVLKEGAAVENLSAIWTSCGVIIPFVPVADDFVCGLWCSREFEPTADVHWSAVEQCLDNHKPYIRREGDEFLVAKPDIEDPTILATVPSEKIAGRIDVLSEELFEGILTALADSEMPADVNVILRSGHSRTALAQKLQRNGIRVSQSSSQSVGADVAAIAPSTIMVRLEGYVLSISDLPAANFASLKTILRVPEGPA